MIPIIGTAGMTSEKTLLMKNPAASTNATIPMTATTRCTILSAAATLTSAVATATMSLMTTTIAEATTTTTIPATQALSADLPLP